MPLFGPKIELALELDRNMFFPGEVINARINLQTNKDFDMEEIRLELICNAKLTYEIYERRYDSEGNEIRSWTTGYASIPIVKQVIRVVEKGKIKKPGLVMDQAVQIPTMVPPTNFGSWVTTEWELKAVVNRRLRRDTVDKREIIVTTAVGDENLKSPTTVPMDFKEVMAGVALPRLVYAISEPINGEIGILARKNMKFDEVRVELVYEENISPSVATSSYEVLDFRGTRKDVAATIIAAEDLEVFANSEIRIPFFLQIPGTQRPSFQTDYYSTSWALKVVLARRLKQDFNLKVPIVITNQVV